MPKFNDNDEFDAHKIPSSNYGYSAAKIDSLSATEYTLVTVVVDESGSTSGFRAGMESCVQEIIKACRRSARADNLMLRLVMFGTNMREAHGFKLLEHCNPGDYKGICQNGGCTALFDSAESAILATSAYAQQLTDNDFTVNGLVVVITDGDDTEHKSTKSQVWKALESCVNSESMESLVSILIGVNINNPMISTYLENFANDIQTKTDPASGLSTTVKVPKFTQYVELDKADEKTLARLAEFVSKSISSQSQALGTGGASKLLTF